jgi:hypothetical protein
LKRKGKKNLFKTKYLNAINKFRKLHNNKKDINDVENRTCRRFSDEPETESADRGGPLGSPRLVGRGVVEEEEGVLVAALQGGGQVVDVGCGQPQRLYLGQLPILGMRRYQVPEPGIFVNYFLCFFASKSVLATYRPQYFVFS